MESNAVATRSWGFDCRHRRWVSGAWSFGLYDFFHRGGRAEGAPSGREGGKRWVGGDLVFVSLFWWYWQVVLRHWKIGSADMKNDNERVPINRHLGEISLYKRFIKKTFFFSNDNFWMCIKDRIIHLMISIIMVTPLCRSHRHLVSVEHLNALSFPPFLRGSERITFNKAVWGSVP